MKSVLMIAYWFPPEGNAAVYRPLRFARNLAAVGWRPRVISLESKSLDRPDQELLAQVPAGTEIVRAPDRDLWLAFQQRRGQRVQEASLAASTASSVSRRPTTAASAADRERRKGSIRPRLRELVRKAESWWYDPDMQMNWIAPALDAARRSCAADRPDVIWATGPPWSSFLVAAKASQLTGIPYVMDFRTSWTIVPSSFEAMRPAWAQHRDRRTLRKLFKGAQAVTFFYAAEAECFWRMYAGALDASRIHVIPNGFDGEVEDFEPAPPLTGKFRIIYTGTLSDYRFDTFLDALAELKRRDPVCSARLSVEFIGEEEMLLVDRVRELGLSDVVSMRSPMPHAEIARLQRNVHALLMFERKPSHKGYELLAGAKLFGYLRAGRPILGVVPEGEAARVLRDVGVSTIADAGSTEAIVAVLERMIGVWSAGGLSSLVPDRTRCEHYSGKEQTVALARALEGLPPLEPFVPGAIDVLEVVPSLRLDLASRSSV